MEASISVHVAGVTGVEETVAVEACLGRDLGIAAHHCWPFHRDLAADDADDVAGQDRTVMAFTSMAGVSAGTELMIVNVSVSP